MKIKYMDKLIKFCKFVYMIPVLPLISAIVLGTFIKMYKENLIETEILISNGNLESKMIELLQPALKYKWLLRSLAFVAWVTFFIISIK